MEEAAEMKVYKKWQEEKRGTKDEVETYRNIRGLDRSQWILEGVGCGEITRPTKKMSRIQQR